MVGPGRPGPSAASRAAERAAPAQRALRLGGAVAAAAAVGHPCRWERVRQRVGAMAAATAAAAIAAAGERVAAALETL